MTDRAALRFGIVGAGRIAQSHARAFEGVPHVSLLGIADLCLQDAETLAKSSGCRAFESAEAMLGSVPIDAAIVCTPPSTHESLSLYLMERGVHVLCEKPLSVHVSSAEAMVAGASRAGRILSVASKYLHVEDMRRAREFIASGRLGRILWVDIVFTAALDLSASWYADPRVSGGGVLMDNGPHAVDIVRYLAGPIVSVSAARFPSAEDMEVEETAQLLMRTASGSMGRAHLSWSIHEPVDYYARVLGSAGILELGWRRSTFRASSQSAPEHVGHGYDKASAFRTQLHDFCATIRGGESVCGGTRDTLASMRVLRAAYHSMAKRRWVAVAS
jgi:predicted dehydrogenase